MAQVTVQQLAEVVGASSERLLSQMKEAGLPHTAADEADSVARAAEILREDGRHWRVFIDIN